MYLAYDRITPKSFISEEKVEREISRGVNDMLQTLKLYYNGLQNVKGKLDINLTTRDNYYRVEVSFDDGRDWADDKASDDFNAAVKNKDYETANNIRLTRSKEIVQQTAS